jgi:hypothetical protein
VADVRVRPGIDPLEAISRRRRRTWGNEERNVNLMNLAAFLAALIGAVVLAPKALSSPGQEPFLTLLFAVCVVLAILNAKRLAGGARRGPR